MFSVVIISSLAISTPTEGEIRPKVIQGQRVEETQHLFTEQEITNLVYAAADKYGVNRGRLLETVKCEAPKEVVDGVLIYDSSKKSQYNEQSYGLAQWNLDSNNRDFDGNAVSKEEATNSVYSVDLMAKYFASGDSHIWSCYRKLYG